MANIPMVESGKNFALGVGVGSYDGQSAIALGASTRLSQSTVVRGSISGGSSGKSAMGVGVSIGW
jgi:autotransporter adhesin